MKFSDLDSIYRKFFYETVGGQKSVSDWWTRERLGQLRKHGYLSSQRVSFSGAAYYLTTKLGAVTLASARTEKTYPRVIPNIDIRTFEHDRRVLTSRQALESSSRATGWISERRLRSEAGYIRSLGKVYVPDGIYVSRAGEKVAFELEIAPKTRERYAQKISHYLDIVRSDLAEASLFQRVLYVVVNEHVLLTLSELTSPYRSNFSVVSYEKLTSGEA